MSVIKIDKYLNSFFKLKLHDDSIMDIRVFSSNYDHIKSALNNPKEWSENIKAIYDNNGLVTIPPCYQSTPKRQQDMEGKSVYYEKDRCAINPINIESYGYRSDYSISLKYPSSDYRSLIRKGGTKKKSRRNKNKLHKHKKKSHRNKK